MVLLIGLIEARGPRARSFGRFQRRLRDRVRGLGIGGGRLELEQRHSALGTLLLPSGLLHVDRRRVALELGELPGEGLGRGRGLVATQPGAVDALAGAEQARLDVRQLHLPMHPLFPRRLLGAFGFRQQCPRPAQLLLETDLRHLAFGERGVDFADALLGSGQPIPEPGDLRLRLGRLAGERLDDARGVLAGGDARPLGLAGPIGGRGGLRERPLEFGQAGRGGGERRFDRVERRAGPRQVGGQALEFGSTAEGPRGSAGP
jgi:hypothetical protein